MNANNFPLQSTAPLQDSIVLPIPIIKIASDLQDEENKIKAPKEKVKISFN